MEKRKTDKTGFGKLFGKEKKKPDLETVKILLAGNVGNKSFVEVKELLDTADLAVCNLGMECGASQDSIEKVKAEGFGLVLDGNEAAENYRLFTMKNVKVAVVSYVHPENEASLRKKIAEAKKDGAEFVLAYVFCGKSEAEDCMKMIASAGADYIYGCGQKLIQPYTLLLTPDHRKVPVFYGGGDFTKNGRPTIIAEVNIRKARQGSALIESEGYHPCKAGSKVRLIRNAMKTCSLAEQIELEESLLKIKSLVGVQDRLACYADVQEITPDLRDNILTEIQKQYEVQPILPVRQKQGTETTYINDYQYDADRQLYARTKDKAVGEAILVCTGHIEYDRMLETEANCFGGYEFLKNFRDVSPCFTEVDFVMGHLATMATSEYPSVAEVSPSTRKSGYNNCRIEFLNALKKTGFNGLAMANEYNAGLGIAGIFETEQEIKAKKMIPSGIGRVKNPIIEINGIKIGFLSVTSSCINSKQILTGEASAKFLNIYDLQRTEMEIQEIKAMGAEFVLAYVHCGLNKRTLALAERKTVGETVAEMGADYVICTGSRNISEYYRYLTKDGRCVPVASSLGCFLTGKRGEDFHSAILKLMVRKDLHGNLSVDDNYIPIKISNCAEDNPYRVCPAHPFFGKGTKSEVYKEAEEAVKSCIGTAIKKNNERVIKTHQDYMPQFTFEQLYAYFGQTPSGADLEKLGDKYHQPISCFAVREDALQENCVAILYGYSNFSKKEEYVWDMQQCIEAGVSLVIDHQPHDELPCIVTEEPLMEVYCRLASEVRRKYNPVTVAITGSMGKTTTKEMTVEVFNRHFNTLTNGGNANVIFQVGQIIQKLSTEDGAYIQEVHGGTMGMASAISKMLSPNICILTNIEKNHMSQVGTLENLIESKMGIIDGLSEDGVLIMCMDNEILRSQNPPVKTITYSVSDESCHYYARNIQADEDGQSFELIVKESEFDHAGTYKIRINLPGKHNVGNAIAAFAAGRQAGIPPHEIIAGLSRYQTKGIRQNTIEHNGIKMILDTHNSNPAALLTMLDVFARLDPDENGKKLLVLGMMGEQGEDSLQIHYETGKKICAYDFDLCFCFGEDAKQMAVAVRECGKTAYYFDDRAIFNEVLARNIAPGDVVMVKGSFSLDLDAETLVPIFGKTIRQY